MSFLVFLFILSLVLTSCVFNANSNSSSNNEKSSVPTENIIWLSYDQALTKSRVEDIPTILYFYSEDCGWCRKMERETFTHQEVQKLLKSDFALAKINGNSNQTVLVDGKRITERQLSSVIYQINGFPTIWFLDNTNQRIANLPGFVTYDVFLDILIYIRDGFYKKYTFLEYQELPKK